MEVNKFLFQDADQNRLNEFVYRRYTHGKISHLSKEYLQEKGSNPVFLDLIVQSFSDESTFPEKELSSFSKETVVEYLTLTHRFYLDVLLPELDQLFVALVNESDLGTLIALSLYIEFKKYTRELQTHIEFEEQSLFPLLLNKSESGKCLFNSLLNKAHHQHEDELAGILKSLMKEAARFEGLLPYSILLEKLKILNKDLVIHALVEDNVLMK